MGCDIHAHIEVKHDGKWQHFAAPNMECRPLLFAVMAGVRKDDVEECLHHMDPSVITTVAWKEGLPDDISYVTRVCHKTDANDYKLHHEGWLDRQTIVDLQKELLRYRGHISRYGPMDLEEDIFHTYISGGSIAAHRGFEDVRIVFWFDN